MAKEVKIECTACKAHYLVDEAEIPVLKCLKCNGSQFITLDTRPAPKPVLPVTPPPAPAPVPAPVVAPVMTPHTDSMPAGIRSLLGLSGIQTPSPSQTQQVLPGKQPSKPSPLVAPVPNASGLSSLLQQVVPVSTPPAAPAVSVPPVTQVPKPPEETQPAAPAPDPSSQTQPIQPAPKSGAEAIGRIRKLRSDVMAEMEKVSVGQRNAIEDIIATILCEGHCIIDGVPGIGKTQLLSALCRTMSLSFRKVELTPDLLPQDLIGHDLVVDDPVTREKKLKLSKGPIFTNVILASSVNHGAPKTQAALVDAMEGKVVHAAGSAHKLGKPFIVVATRNPADNEAPHPLSASHRDRFIFNISLGYPTRGEEAGMVRRASDHASGDVAVVCSASELSQLQNAVKAIKVGDNVIEYANRLSRATRPGQDGAIDIANNFIACGASPAVTMDLVTAAKCYAATDGRSSPSCDDVARAVKPVMRHRIILNGTAKSQGQTEDQILTKILEAVAKY